MEKKRLAWKAELGRASTFSAQFGNLITYYVATGNHGHPAYVEVRGPRGLKRLNLGFYVKMEQAKQACERHYKAGCDMSKAEKIIR